MSLERDISAIKFLVEQEDPAFSIFQPADIDQRAQRLYPDDSAARERYINAFKAAKSPDEFQRLQWEAFDAQQRILREREKLAREAFFASLPYTYADIVRLPVYEKIICLENTEDITTERMMKNRTTAFEINFGENNYDHQTYAVYATGAIRYDIFIHPGRILQVPVVTTLEVYGQLMERLLSTMERFIRLRTRRKQQFAKRLQQHIEWARNRETNG